MFTNGDELRLWSPAIVLITEKKWGRITLTNKVGLKQETFTSDWGWQGTADLKYELSKQWQIFVEYFGQYGQEEPLHNLDAGLLYFPSKHWLVHISGGSSVDHDPGIVLSMPVLRFT